MKKTLSFILTLVMLLSLCACGGNQTAETTAAGTETAAANETAKQTESVSSADTAAAVNPALLGLEIETHYIYNQEDSVTLIFDEVELCDEDEDKYPQLEKALEEYFELAENGYKDRAKLYVGYADYVSLTYSASALRADENIVSLEFTSDEAGTSTYSVASFYTGSGKEVKLSEIVSDEEAFFNQLYSEVQNHDGEDEALYSGSAASGAELKAEYEQGLLEFALTYYGITFFGSVSSDKTPNNAIATIGYNEADGYEFSAVAKSVPDSWMAYAFVDTPYIYDVNGDGAGETIRFNDSEIDEYSKTFYVAVDGQRIEFGDEAGYSADGYVVCSGGSYYFYNIALSDNDWEMLLVADLAGLSCDTNDYQLIGSAIIESETESDNEFVTRERLLTDPSCMTFGSRVDALGTYSVYSIFAAGADGKPEMTADWYMASGRVLKALKDVACVSPEGAVLEAGKYYLPIRTNADNIREEGEIWVEFKELSADEITIQDGMDFYYTDDDGEVDEDDTVYRVTAVFKDYSYTVAGEDEYSVFAGVMYSG